MNGQTTQLWHVLLGWFSGGGTQYMTLGECLRDDMFWLMSIVVVNLIVSTGHLLIAGHCELNRRALGDSPAASAMGSKRNIFVCTALCYFSMPIGIFWPAWRLWVLLTAVLAYFTIRYAVKAPALTYVYSEVRDAATLEMKLAAIRDEIDILLLQPEIDRAELQRTREALEQIIAES